MAGRGQHTSEHVFSATDWQLVVIGTALSRPCQAVRAEGSGGFIAPVALGDTAAVAGCDAIAIADGEILPIQAIKFVAPASGSSPTKLYALFNTERIPLKDNTGANIPTP